MWLFPYSGGWAETSARNPELLVRLAPGIENYQEACLRAGGRNRYGDPMFRLIITRSRFQHGGGIEVNFHKPNGQFHHSEEIEAFIPRYLEKDGYDDCFALEMWRPPEWYEAQGFGDDRTACYSPDGKRFQQLDPLPSRGGYEALIWDGCWPWSFTPREHVVWFDGRPRTQARCSAQTIEKAIRLWMITESWTAKQRSDLHLEQMAAEVKSGEDYIEDKIIQKCTIFDFKPAVSMFGRKSAGRFCGSQR